MNSFWSLFLISYRLFTSFRWFYIFLYLVIIIIEFFFNEAPYGHRHHIHLDFISFGRYFSTTNENNKSYSHLYIPSIMFSHSQPASSFFWQVWTFSKCTFSNRAIFNLWKLVFLNYTKYHISGFFNFSTTIIPKYLLELRILFYLCSLRLLYSLYGTTTTECFDLMRLRWDFWHR